MPEKREIYHLTVPEEMAGERLDSAVVKLVQMQTENGEISRTRVQNIIKEGFLLLDGKAGLPPRTRLTAGQTIDIDAPAPEITVKAEPEAIPLDVLFEDESILVVNKPAGMVVHPGAGNWSGTLVNAVLGREPDMNLMLEDDSEIDPLRPGIVHRLDKDTSGALIIAKTPRALRRLSKAFAEREVEKNYLAIVHGTPIPTSSVIKTAFGRHPVDRKKMAVLRQGEGKEAVTAYRVLKTGWRNGRKVSLIQVRLHTGRTHQIRVHMAHMGFPLLGEKLYNRGHAPDADRQMLHAWKLEIYHPETDEVMAFEAKPPADFIEAVDSIQDEKN